MTDDASELHKLKTTLDELKAINNLLDKVSRVRETNRIMEIIISELVKTTGADQGIINLVSPSEDDILATVVRSERPATGGLPYKVSGLISGSVLKSRRILNIDDLDKDERFPGLSSDNGRNKSIICCPMIVRNEIIGLTTVIRGSAKESFSGDHRRQVGILTSQSAQILSNALLLEELAQKNELLEISRRRQLEKVHRELTETQAKLVHSEKMASLGLLVAGIAHEINTPIGAVKSMHDTLVRSLEKLKKRLEAEFSKDKDEGGNIQVLLQTIDDANKVINSGTVRVTDIVRRLKSFARLDEAEIDTVDIHDGLEDTLTIIHHEIKHRAKVIKKYGNIPPIPCYPGQLNQVFLNLLINAGQAIKDEGEIIIKTYQAGNRVHIEIRDNGIGIPSEIINRIFDPGFTTKGVGVGTGLGLSICYQIIQDHKGEIKVESEVGKGTVFTVILPMDLGENSLEDDK